VVLWLNQFVVGFSLNHLFVCWENLGKKEQSVKMRKLKGNEYTFVVIYAWCWPTDRYNSKIEKIVLGHAFANHSLFEVDCKAPLFSIPNFIIRLDWDNQIY
jgi:hypothetical protein